MTILASNLGVFKARTNNDLAGNGGRASLTKLNDASKNSIFSDLESSASIANDVETRKVFIKQNLANISTSEFSNAYAYLRELGDDDVLYSMGYGTATDTMNGATLDLVVGRVVSVSPNVVVKTLAPKSGVTSLVRYRPSTNSLITVDNVSLTSGSNQVTLSNITASDFAVGDIITEKVYATSRDGSSPLNLKPRVYGVSVTNGSTFDETLITFAPKAAVAVDVTLDFINTSAYSWSIPDLGMSGSGSVDSDLKVYHPNAPSQADEYLILSIPAAAFSGAWASTSLISFSIESGNVPLWFRRTISDSPSISGIQPFNFGLEYATS